MCWDEALTFWEKHIIEQALAVLSTGSGFCGCLLRLGGEWVMRMVRKKYVGDEKEQEEV